MTTKNNNQTEHKEQTSITEQEKAELYKYFDKDEIQHKMQHALDVLVNNDVDKGEIAGLHQLCKDLLKEDGFAVTPKQIEAKWGKPDKKKKQEFPNDFTDEMQPSYTYTYPQFKLQNERFDDEWIISSVYTGTIGFGFIGIYVGIPECNKDFINKLFAKAENIEKGENKGEEFWNINICGASHTAILITFNKNGTVKRVLYDSAIYIH